MVRVQRLNRLTSLAVQKLTEPGWHADGGGLYLEITASGRKRWALRITSRGKTRDFGLGPLHKVSLKDAREAAANYRSKIQQGLDPTEDKKPTMAAAPSLLACAHDVHRLRQAHQRNGKHVRQWMSQLEHYIPTQVAEKPINMITTADVMTVLSPIWGEKQETARRIRQRLKVILDWARASGFRTGDNPVDLIGEALPRQRRTKRHHAALPYPQVGAFITALRNGHADRMSKLAFEFLILTAARTSEVRFARRDEIDLTSQLWTIPGDNEVTKRRMKSGREHIVPLTPRMVEILKEAMKLVPVSDLVFPDRESGQPMSENRFLIARDALGYAKRCTPHGFRSSFRDWVAEETHFSSEVAEMALAHVVKSAVEAAYRRGDLLAKRRELMLAWERYALNLEAPADMKLVSTS